MEQFQELNNDQRREFVNTQQRYASFREAKRRHDGYRGSMVWAKINNTEYLVRSSYDRAGLRRQTSLGVRSQETEKIKAAFDEGRTEAEQRLKAIREVLTRQAAINRAIALGRMPLVGARIVRALDKTGMLGAGIRVVGTNAIYAFEAAAGVQVDAGLATTEDIDPRGGLTFVAGEDFPEKSLLQILRKVDRSFERSQQKFRAVNRDGYLVDLIRPMRNPPWTADRETIAGDNDDLAAVQIAGLAWLESAPSFEGMVIDERGEPFRIVTTDPRAWAVHKLWLSKQPDREPVRKKRDEAQARAIGRLVAERLPQFPFASDDMRMLPRELVADAAQLFASPAQIQNRQI
jgi:hypothetical protein